MFANRPLRTYISNNGDVMHFYSAEEFEAYLGSLWDSVLANNELDYLADDDPVGLQIGEGHFEVTLAYGYESWTELTHEEPDPLAVH